MKPWEHFAAQAAVPPPTRRIPKRPLEGAERAEHEQAAASAAAESEHYAAESERDLSLGGRVKGTLKEIGGDLMDSNFGLDYLKDYGRGIATSLEDAGDEFIDPGEAIRGVVAPAIEYPLAMGAGALSLPFSGDYGGVRDAAFESMEELTQTQGSRKAQGIAGALLKPAGDVFTTAGEGLGEIVGSLGVPEELQENVADISTDVLGFMGVKGKAPKGTPVLNPKPPVRAPVTPGRTADPLARARDAGYTLPGSARTVEARPASRIGSAAEGVSGRTSNQARVDQLNDLRVLEGIRKDLGLPKKAAITEPAIKAIMDDTEKVKTAVSATIPLLHSTPALLEAVGGIGAKRRDNPYLKETPSVAKLRQRMTSASEGTVETQKVMTAIQEMRDDARILSRNAEKPEAKQRAKASREAADILENALDAALVAQGRPDVIPALKNMRIRRAKALQAQEAVSGKKRPGNALMDMKLAGEKLSGEMELAADVHLDLHPTGPLSVNTAAVVGNQPGAIVEALQGVARPLIQPILNSEFGQRRMFGPRVPESLSPYDPKQFDVPELPGSAAPTGSIGESVAPASDRRRLATGDRGEAERRSSILRDRQAVLDQPIGTKPRGQQMADELLSDPVRRAEVDADHQANRKSLLRREIGDELSDPDASIQAAIDQLREFGLTDEQILEFLAQGQ